MAGRPDPVVRLAEVVHGLGLVQGVLAGQSLQMVGNSAVQTLEQSAIRQVAPSQGSAGLGVEEVPLPGCAPLDQMGPEGPAQGGQPQVVPGLCRDARGKQPGCDRDQDAEVAFAPAKATGGNQAGEGLDPRPAVHLLRVRKQPVV